ncbi:PREDICTED: uncharacterized protein LOC101305449 [Fragaria vesca subsp. vesca]|uniref:uncharacterized protein LOC101305449 n=1 Tax=Fragaria vesca subsp. vesca TaxID=101020 RepID=UPI0002C31D72|nr:PREDICTED: uncharacterized protein LOC101305449 [Fragaria vesca subsp. vesca]
MDPSMYRAATCGDVGILQKIRNGEVSVDLLSYQTPKGNNVLHLAAEFKRINVFTDIPLDKHSPLFWSVNKMGDTPLHIAARVGCDEVIDFLIERAKALHVRRANDQERGPTYAKSYKKLLRKTNLKCIL